MTPLTLTLRQEPRQRVDLSPLLPERFAGLDAAAVAAIPLTSGNRRVPVGDLFAVAPGDPSALLIRGACGKLDNIGRDMTAGSITVEGDAGAYLGLGMAGGELRVHGNAGPGAATGLRGGLVAIDGDAGDHVGGALPGDMRGMRGGLVLVRGNAGDRAADRMGRGIIVVEGNLGAYAGSRMIAGTLVALGAVGAYPGLAMRRGTLLLRRTPERMLPTFADCGSHDLNFLRLLLRSLRGYSRRLAQIDNSATLVRRLAGDAAAGGKGEILLWRSGPESG